jgi:hypothetical protein
MIVLLSKYPIALDKASISLTLLSKTSAVIILKHSNSNLCFMIFAKFYCNPYFIYYHPWIYCIFKIYFYSCEECDKSCKTFLRLS